MITCDVCKGLCDPALSAGVKEGIVEHGPYGCAATVSVTIDIGGIHLCQSCTHELRQAAWKAARPVTRRVVEMISPEHLALYDARIAEQEGVDVLLEQAPIVHLPTHSHD